MCNSSTRPEHSNIWKSIASAAHRGNQRQAARPPRQQQPRPRRWRCCWNAALLPLGDFLTSATELVAVQERGCWCFYRNIRLFYRLSGSWQSSSNPTSSSSHTLSASAHNKISAWVLGFFVLWPRIKLNTADVLFLIYRGTEFHVVFKPLTNKHTVDIRGFVVLSISTNSKSFS